MLRSSWTMNSARDRELESLECFGVSVLRCWGVEMLATPLLVGKGNSRGVDEFSRSSQPEAPADERSGMGARSTEKANAHVLQKAWPLLPDLPLGKCSSGASLPLRRGDLTYV
jgi:hypothetical protein